MISSDIGTNRRLVADRKPQRLRIGMVAPQFPPAVGGMQELAFGLATGLAQYSDVRLYTLAGNGLAHVPFEQQPVLVKKDLKANLEVLLSREGDVDAWLAMDAGLAPLARSLKRPFFNYFHGNDFLTPGYGFRHEWGALLTGRPVVWRFARRVKRFQRRRVMRRSLSSVQEIFTNSRSTADLIEQTYPSHGRPVTVIPPGVADVFFQTGDHTPADTLRLLTISRLTRQARRKNVEGVLRALQLLKRDAPALRFHYTIVGDGNDRPRLEELARTLQLHEQVRFSGFVTREELLAALRGADLFVLAPKATAYDVEGFGIVYIEASASGVPVVGSAEGGATDAIETGTNGLLIETSTPAAIADGIRRFHAERHRFSADRVRAFAERFRWHEISARVRDRIAAHVG